MHKILLVDDDERILNSFSRRLRKDGFEVVTAESGEKALEKMNAVMPDLIISDMRMPGIDGVKLMEQIPRKDGFFPGKIIFTAFDDNEAYKLAHVSSSGVFRINKDRWETDLKSAIARALEIHMLQVEAWKQGKEAAELKAIIVISRDLSHRINNSLNGIFTAVSFIKGLPEDHRHIERINVSMHKIHHVVMDLNNVTKMDEGEKQSVEFLPESSRLLSGPTG